MTARVFVFASSTLGWSKGSMPRTIAERAVATSQRTNSAPMSIFESTAMRMTGWPAAASAARLASTFEPVVGYGPSEPATIRALLRRCLDRNAKNRLRNIGEARIAIEAAFQPADPPAPPPKPQSPFAWIAAAVVFALSFGALAFVHFREAPPQRQRVKFQIDPPAGELGGFRLSPDGRFLAIVTSEGSTTRKIWIRSLDGLETRLLTDIQGLRSFTLFWSWDGEQIAFQSGDKLYKIARIGGPPVVLADAPRPIQGGVWRSEEHTAELQSR